MKFCATCGKILNDSSEEYTINGILQCENCAYNIEDSTQGTNNPSITKSKAGWANTLKTIGGVNIFVGIAASLALSVCLYKLVYGDSAILIAIVAFIVGIVLSIFSSALLITFAELAENVSAIRYLKEQESLEKQFKNNN